MLGLETLMTSTSAYGANACTCGFGLTLPTSTQLNPRLNSLERYEYTVVLARNLSINGSAVFVKARYETDGIRQCFGPRAASSVCKSVS